MPGENDPVKFPVKEFTETGYEKTYKLEKWQLHMLRIQHKHDRRMFPPRYLWHVNVAQAEPNPTYEELPDSERQYGTPQPAMFFVNSNPSKYLLEKWGVDKIDEGVTVFCEMSEAERLRLATVFEPNNPEVWIRWRPNPGDLFFWDGVLYFVHDFRGKAYYGTSSTIAAWVMPCSQYRFDSAHQQYPVEIPTAPPEIPRWPLLGNRFLPLEK